MRQALVSNPRGCGAGPLRPRRLEGRVRHRHGGTCCSDLMAGTRAIAESMVPPCAGPSSRRPRVAGAEISSTRMAKLSPDTKRPARSVHQRVASRRSSPRQRAPAVPIEHLLEALPDAVVIVDAGGQIVYANGLLETLSGYRREELLGQLIEFLVPERFRQLHTKHRSGYVANPRARPMGVNLDIYLRRTDGTEFPADIALSPLQTAGCMVVVAAVRDATERKQAQMRLHRLAVLEDRERIAKELHDGVIQALFAVGMNLQATEAKAGDPEAVRARISGAVDSIDVAIRDLRNYIFGLRPGILADRQLDQALHQLAEEFQEKSGVVTAVEIDERVAAQFGNSATQLVQVTREALSNVARHAQATTCRVSLLQHDESAVLEIDDDGRGFKPGRGSSRGQGLSHMRERVEAIGGTFSVESASGEGTTVRVQLPL